MQPGRSPSRYTWVAIVLHWAMALGIAALAALGLVMDHVKLGPMQLFQLYQLHKSIGVTVLLAAGVRLAWRLGRRPPALPAAMPRIERAAAHGGHLMLYVLMLALPLSGWALVSSSTLDLPTMLYGVVRWPDLPILSTLADKAPVEAALKTIHAWVAYALIALVGVHAAAALRHHFIVKDDVLLRMLPMAPRPRTPAAVSPVTQDPTP